MDTNLHSFVGPTDSNRSVLLEGPPPDDPRSYSSAIKITGGIDNLMLQADSPAGGRDAVVDINNRASHISVILVAPAPRGQFLATIKGGAHDIHLCANVITAHGSVTDIILDDWSDQSHAPTANIYLDCTMADKSPVRVIALKAPPSLIPGSGPYAFPWWHHLNLRIGPFYLIGSAFEIVRRWGFFRSAANNP